MSLVTQTLLVSLKPPKNNKRKRRRKKRVKCGGIILNKNKDKIIIVLNNYYLKLGEKKWSLPKGQLYREESYECCAEREIREETGLKLSIGKKNRYIKVLDIFYFKFILDDKVYSDFNPEDKKEIATAKWCKIEDLHSLNMNRSLRYFYNNYKKYVNR